MDMEEQKLVERPLMSEGEFKDYMEKNRVDIVGDFYERGILHLRTYEAVSRFKSVRRAIRRGHISLDGVIYPKRPFNNAKHKKGSLNDEKKRIYEQLKHRQRKTA
jgi:hypothetical protein|nr:MAG TPA: hypothetical protein [Crassvirales sp.]